MEAANIMFQKMTNVQVTAPDYTLSDVHFYINKIVFNDPLYYNMKAAKLLSSGLTIGYQTWMNKNLAIDRFKNGDIIPMAKTDEEWQSAAEGKQPAWCYYNDDVTNGEIYGKLYNWYAVNDLRGICPEGWHVASDKEWVLLTNYFGGINTAGGKLKATKTNYWQAPNVGATNIRGFSALPGGYRDFDGGFYLGGYQGFFWSHTKNNDEYAWGRTMYNSNAGVNRYYYEMSLGASIRCLKD
jgi:uncharacterized protein (TIGR02145 family)